MSVFREKEVVVSSDCNMVMLTLRLQSWELAKGELMAMLQTYWAMRGDGAYDKAQELFERLITDVADEHL